MGLTVAQHTPLVEVSLTAKMLMQCGESFNQTFASKFASDLLEAEKLTTPIFGVKETRNAGTMELGSVIQNSNCNFTPKMALYFDAEKIENKKGALNATICLDDMVFGDAVNWFDENLPGTFTSDPYKRPQAFLASFLNARLIRQIKIDNFGENAFRAKCRPDEIKAAEAANVAAPSDSLFDGIFQNLYNLGSAGNATIIPDIANMTDADDVYNFFNQVLLGLPSQMRKMLKAGVLRLNISPQLANLYCEGHKRCNPHAPSRPLTSAGRDQALFFGKGQTIMICVVEELAGTDFWWIGSPQNFKQVHWDSSEMNRIQYGTVACEPIRACAAWRFNYQLMCRDPRFWAMSENFNNINPDLLERYTNKEYLPQNTSPLGIGF